jgi:hypothetical protein
MMNITQAVFSVAITSLAMGTANPVLLGTAAIASQCPDLDTSRSVIGRLPILQDCAACGSGGGKEGSSKVSICGTQGSFADAINGAVSIW